MYNYNRAATAALIIKKTQMNAKISYYMPIC